MKSLKVYGWQGWRRECVKAPNDNKATREICAATSKLAVAKLAGKKYASQLFCLCQTGNKIEIETAMKKPGTIFWRGIDAHSADPYNEAQEIKYASVEVVTKAAKKVFEEHEELFQKLAQK